MMAASFSTVEGKPKYLQLLLHGQEWRLIHTDIFSKQPQIPPGFPDCFPEWELQQAKQYVLKKLCIRSYHSQELMQALQDRLVSDGTIEKVLSDLTRMGLVDDSDWL